MFAKSLISLDEYAQSMFRFERINAAWVTRCSKYLVHVFGDALNGAVVIDYAFGRGNWSLAFLQAGAGRVIAIDAAKSNVDRFSAFCQANNIYGIEIIHGNILENPIDAKADILWAYGILHHIENPQGFISRLTGMWNPRGKGLGLIYAYDKLSLRHIIVDLARRGLLYHSYAEFLQDSFLFSHFGRMRGRDDLTAPHIDWYSERELIEVVNSAGAVPKRFVESFCKFLKTENAEFRPHHLLFSRTGGSTIVTTRSSLGIDEKIINDFGALIFRVAPPAVIKKLTVGLINTHFDALSFGGYEQALIHDFLYLLYVFQAIDVPPDNFEGTDFLDAAINSLDGAARGPILGNSVIMSYLSQNTIRI